jgi:hypothetical protein
MSAAGLASIQSRDNAKFSIFEISASARLAITGEPRSVMASNTARIMGRLMSRTFTCRQLAPSFDSSSDSMMRWSSF